MAKDADADRQTNVSSDRATRPRILVVEGDEPLRLLVAEMLSEAGWALHISNDGERALEAVRTGDAFDAVIFDVQTAVIEPRTFLRRLRKLAPDTPVVALSGHGAKSIRRVLRVDGVVGKPPEYLAMIHELESVLDAG